VKTSAGGESPSCASRRARADGAVQLDPREGVAGDDILLDAVVVREDEVDPATVDRALVVHRPVLLDHVVMGAKELNSIVVASRGNVILDHDLRGVLKADPRLAVVRRCNLLHDDVRRAMDQDAVVEHRHGPRPLDHDIAQSGHDVDAHGIRRCERWTIGKITAGPSDRVPLQRNRNPARADRESVPRADQVMVQPQVRRNRGAAQYTRRGRDRHRDRRSEKRNDQHAGKSRDPHSTYPIHGSPPFPRSAHGNHNPFG